MSDSQNWYDIGREIRDAVTDTLRTGDFERLGDTLAGTVNEAVEEARRQGEAALKGRYQNPYSSHYRYSSTKEGTWRTENDFGKTRVRQNNTESGKEVYYGTVEDKNGRTVYRNRHQSLSHTGYGKNTMDNPGGSAGLRPQVRSRKTNSAELVPFKVNRSANTKYWVQTVGGGAASVLTGFDVLAATAGALFFGTGLLPILGSAALCTGFGILAIHGAKGLGLMKRSDLYAKVAGTKAYLELEELANRTGRDLSFVVKDVKKMLQKGIFPEGHLDNERTTLMLTNEVYDSYVKLKNRQQAEERAEIERQKAEQQQEALRRKELEEQQAAEEAAAKKAYSDRLVKLDTMTAVTYPELSEMVEQGNEYIVRLHALNDRIEGEVISGKLYRLEDLMREIFSSVVEHPNQMKRMHKFMQYYLPTTLKLVEAYKEFDSISAPGEDVLQAKAEIEATLDTINSSFEELLNQLFIESVYDATTDAQVLKTMLEKEGLSGDSPFKADR